MWTRNYGALGQTARVCFGMLCANRTREVKRDFCDLPIRRSEGRVVNTPLVFKRVLFEKKGKKGQESPGERTDGRRRRDGKRVGERKSEARLEWRKGLSPEIGVKKTMNAGGVENGNLNCLHRLGNITSLRIVYQINNIFLFL
ncbi:hypothetical protein TNCV_1124541 [Trichonephila clavipes]|uniref:Uncharacterized protein n=1 Tax=Trichonephila clavipes TaxID=2585209 RepID=A0A8X6SKU9_TRICX|nr:hypothetical protein TNCV_1124541 [Trichonephila clavipes]